MCIGRFQVRDNIFYFQFSVILRNEESMSLASWILPFILRSTSCHCEERVVRMTGTYFIFYATILRHISTRYRCHPHRQGYLPSTHESTTHTGRWAGLTLRWRWVGDDIHSYIYRQEVGCSAWAGSSISTDWIQACYHTLSGDAEQAWEDRVYTPEGGGGWDISIRIFSIWALSETPPLTSQDRTVRLYRSWSSRAVWMSQSPRDTLYREGHELWRMRDEYGSRYDMTHEKVSWIR